MNIDWKTVGLTIATFAVLGAVAAAVWVGFGLYNVSARMGHLPGMSWVLHTTYRNSVDLWSDESRKVPAAIKGADMIALGAKHYEGACRVCHSAPGAIRTATAKSLLPQPPHIEEAVRHWSPTELHWIVHEGVKMSGMPGWPAPREEEVWPVVAFLVAVQSGMKGKEYEALTRLQRDEPFGLPYCVSCHGEDGSNDNAFVPRLDILSERYITLALASYRDGSRQSGIMEHAASEVPEAELARFAAYFGGKSPDSRSGAQQLSDLARRGRDVAFANAGGNDNVPACRACHGPWEEELDTLFPSLAGQHEPYLAQQLRLWRDEQRGGGLAAGLMHQAARDLTDADIEAVSAYYAALTPSELNQVTDIE